LPGSRAGAARRGPLPGTRRSVEARGEGQEMKGTEDSPEAGVISRTCGTDSSVGADPRACPRTSAGHPHALRGLPLTGGQVRGRTGSPLPRSLPGAGREAPYEESVPGPGTIGQRRCRDRAPVSGSKLLSPRRGEVGREVASPRGLPLPGGTYRLNPIPGFRVLCIVFLLLIATTGIALAHANLVRSDPPANASLKVAPTRVQLWFSEELEPSFSKVVVYDTSQQVVDRGDSHVAPDDPRSMIVSLKPNLPNGTYAIAWETQSRIDGHVVRGIVPFGVGVASAPSTSTASEGVAAGAVSGSPFEMALRWLTLLSICALAGTFAFWMLQDGVLVGTSGAASATSVRSAQVRLGVGVWILFLVSNVALLLNQASLAVGVSFLGAIGSPAVEVAALTHYGHLWIARMALGIELGAIVLTRERLLTGDDGKSRLVDQSSLVIGGLLLLSVSLSSHSAAFGSLSPLGVANDWLHLAAVAVWVGGLLQLLALIPAVLRTGAVADRTAPLTRVVPRFSVVAGISLAVLGVTGLGEAVLH